MYTDETCWLARPAGGEGVGTDRGVKAAKSVGLAVTFFLLLEGIGFETDSLEQSSSSLGLLYKEHLKSNFAM